MTAKRPDPRRRIPPIDRLLASDAFAALREMRSPELLRRALRDVLAQERARLTEDAGGTERSDLDEGRAADEGAGSSPGTSFSATEAERFADAVADRIAALDRPTLRPVINATGVVLHTNLGRAPLAKAARDAIARAAGNYTNLEYDLEGGRRGSRYDHCVALLCELTGAEEALVVNNNAAAVVLALNTIALGREVLISRGELVEIGGSFRVAEIIERSGARMREVGATNRTHLTDYGAALDGAAAILKVHPSNFRMSGFTSDVQVAELAPLARRRSVPLIADQGSGLLIDLRPIGLPHEPTVRDVLCDGATFVTMSGDKLLGGPQAGIILGDAEGIARMRANPLCRALRVDKLTLAALAATLALYREPDRALAEIPALRMLATPPSALAARAGAMADKLAGAGVPATTRPGRSAVGGGAYPDAALDTTLVAIAVDDADALHAGLRAADPPVVARIEDGALVIDPRTVAEDEESALIATVIGAV